MAMSKSVCLLVCRDEKPADALTVRHGPETDDYNRDFIERDEKRLADLGRKTVEMYVIAHIIADLEVRRRMRISYHRTTHEDPFGKG